MQQQLQQQLKRNKRNRKDPDTMRYLMQEFRKDPTWSKETYQRVARETGLSESQVYKWGWDQKNKKNEDQDETDDEQDADEQQAQEEAEEKEKENDKDDLKLQLDLAISQVVINNDELNHGIILPHKINEISNESYQQAEHGKDKLLKEKKANKENVQNTSSDSQKGMLGKRPLHDSSNTDKCSTTFTQHSK